MCSGRFALDHLPDGADVLGRRAAAAADQVEPAVFDEPLQGRGQRRRRLKIGSLFVGQTGVRIAGYAGLCHAVDRPDVVGHELRTGGAVQPDREQIHVPERRHQSVGRLSGQHGSHRLNGRRDHDRQAVAELVERLSDADERGLDVARVLAGLKQQQVAAAFGQRLGLFAEGVNQFVERDPPGNRDGLGRRPHRAGHETRLPRRGALLGRPPRQLCGGHIDLANLIFQIVFSQDDRHSSERVRLDDVGPGFEVFPVNVQDDIRAGQNQVFVAALERRTAEILRREIPFLQASAHGAVQDGDSLVEDFVKQFRLIVSTTHG